MAFHLKTVKAFVADSGKAEKANLALLTQPLELRNDLTEHLLDAEGFPARQVEAPLRARTQFGRSRSEPAANTMP